MADESEDLAEQKQRLENEKLRVDIAKAGAELEVLEQKQRLENEKLRVDIAKARAELEVLEQKRDGREKMTRLQWLQALSFFAAAITAIVAACNYIKSDRDARQQRLQATIEQYRKGWLPAVVDLGMRGRDGLRVLVAGVHSDRDPSEPDWPNVTRATLGELVERQKLLTKEDREHLAVVAQQNSQAIEQLLNATQDAELTPDQQQHLNDLTCVQLELTKLVPPVTTWPQILDAVRERLRGLPHC